MPLSRWSSAELADEAVAAGVVDTICPCTVRRWLRGDALKPWQYRSWIAPRAPDFAVKAARVLDLYNLLTKKGQAPAPVTATVRAWVRIGPAAGATAPA